MCATPRYEIAVRQARSTTLSTCAAPMMRSLNAATSMNTLSSSTSCWLCVPMRSWYCRPVMASTGWPSSFAS
ncbi:hypothetical protein D3C83_34790 [compost metagenome]